MGNDSVCVYTSLTSPLMKNALLRGTLMAFIGLCPMFYAAISFNERELQTWGVMIFLIGFIFITIGMLPFKRLKALENGPDCLKAQQDTGLVYTRQGKKIATIPFESIRDLAFIKNQGCYGMGIQLKENTLKKVEIHTNRFDFVKFRRRSLQQTGYDCFFPFFSERSCRLIKEILPSSHPLNT